MSAAKQKPAHRVAQERAMRFAREREAYRQRCAEHGENPITDGWTDQVEFAYYCGHLAGYDLAITRTREKRRAPA